MTDTPVSHFDPWLAEQPDRQPLEEKRHEHDAAKDRLTKNAAKGGELKQRYQYKSGTELRVEQDRGDEQAIRRVVREAQRLAAELEEQDAVTEGLQAPEYRADQACKAVERPFRLRHGTELAEALVQRAHAFLEAANIYVASRAQFKQRGGGSGYPRPAGPTEQLLRIAEDVFGSVHG